MLEPTGKKISILLAVFNGEKFIEEAVNSVFIQSHFNWELIIVDNGSTDRTLSIGEKLADQHERIFFYSLNEKGKTRAYNLAFEKSTGDYICFFAADDRLTQFSFEKRLSVITGEGMVFSTCLLKTFSEDPLHDGVIFPKNQQIPNFSGGCTLFPRDLAEMSFPVPLGLPNEDTWTMLHLRAFGKYIHIPEVLIEYRIHNNNSYGYSLSFEEKRSKFLQRMEAYQLFYDKYKGLSNSFVESYVKDFIRGFQLVKSNQAIKIMAINALPIRDRMIFVFYTSPLLYKIRYKYFKFFSGLFN